MKDTGERMIDEAHEGKPVWGEHYSRYIFSKQFVNDKVVVDGSCGSGYGTNYLSKFGKAKLVYGIDLSSEAIKYAKRHYPSKDISFLAANLEKIPLEDKSIDVFISFETIEHVKDYEKFVKEIKRVLKNDGILVLSTPNSKVYPKGNPFHTKEFDHVELNSLLKKYFNNTDFLYQDNWISSSILTAKDSLEYDIENEVEIKANKILGKQPEESLYFVVLASNTKITKVNTTSAFLPMPSELNYFYVNQVKLTEMSVEIARLNKNITEKQTELDNIYNSRSWKTVLFLKRLKNLLTKRNNV